MEIIHLPALSNLSNGQLYHLKGYNKMLKEITPYFGFCYFQLATFILLLKQGYNLVDFYSVFTVPNYGIIANHLDRLLIAGKSILFPYFLLQ